AAVSEPFHARAVVLALLLGRDPARRPAQLAVLGNDPVRAEAERLVGQVEALPEAAWLPLLDLALPALRQLSPAQYRTFRGRGDRVTEAGQQWSPFEYPLGCVLTRHLDADFARKRPVVRYRSAGAVLPQARAVLGVLAWEGHDTEEQARAAFEAGLRTFL